MADDKTILHIEDNFENRLLVRRILVAEGYEVLEAGNASEAIDILSTITPDLILMDINMPGIDGFETTAEIRKFNPQVPIVALTASDKFEIQKLLEKSSMNDILVKQFEWLDLLHIIEKHIQEFIL